MTLSELTETLDWERRRAGTLCQTLAQRDYINLFRSGILMLTTLGMREIGGGPPPKPQKEMAQQAPVSPEENLRLDQALAKMSVEDKLSLAKILKEGDEGAEKNPMSAAERAAMIRARLDTKVKERTEEPRT